MRIAAPIWRAIALAVVAATARADGGQAGFSARDMGVVVNTRDPLSVAIGEYYRSRRQIPAENIARIELDPRQTTITIEAFERARDAVDAALPANIQAYALTWAQPYAVACMSITTAFSMGFDAAFCSDGCNRTRLNPYYGSSTRRPREQLGMRLAMSITARDINAARSLIDRGVAAGRFKAGGSAYLVITQDSNRNVRSAGFEDARRAFANQLPVRIEYAPALNGKQDVMFYFIGAAQVPNLESNRFLPGAVADHLTSFGGQLTNSSQMSSLRWLEAGATGSYGTVTEPCNFPAKFPSPALLMKHYLAGDTLIEAYWKSVAMPGQGIFIGEPLARPYGKASSVAMQPRN